MSTWLTRLVEEQQQLELKVHALAKFIEEGNSANLDETNKDLLGRQLVAMIEYNDVLLKRIEINTAN